MLKLFADGHPPQPRRFAHPRLLAQREEAGAIFFYREKDQKEIDLLIEQDGTLYPVEIKKSASPTRDAARHFEVAQRLGMPVGHGALICLVKQVGPLNPMVKIRPGVF